MSKLIKVFFLLALPMALSGGEVSPPNPAVAKTEIVTFPSNAAIAVDGRYLGQSPVTITLPQDQGKVTGRTLIEVEPNVAGQYRQHREILGAGRKDPVPYRIMIDLRTRTTHQPSASFEVANRKFDRNKPTGSAKGARQSLRQPGKRV